MVTLNIRVAATISIPKSKSFCPALLGQDGSRKPNICPTRFAFRKRVESGRPASQARKTVFAEPSAVLSPIMEVQHRHDELPMLTNQYFAERQQHFELERNLAQCSLVL